MALIEADESLRFQKVSLTREEAEILNSWRNNAIRDLGIGMSIASIASWLVTGRLNNFFRANIAAGNT
nr:Mitochondrial intermediate peptidase [Ipomoea batatas]